jgi:L-asparaginase/Glu-tRNA(Gln) amidotransferase subunit D
MNTKSEADSKIVVFMAGGFIAEKYDANTGFNINTSTIETVEAIKNEKNLNIEICEFSLIDSCSADLDYLYELAKVIQRKVNFYNTKGMSSFKTKPSFI